MKTLNHLLTPILFLLIGLINTGQSQSTHVITLFVNTAEVEKNNTESSCNFGQAAGISNRDYTVQVNVGDIIIWKGVSTNAPGTDRVDIKSVNHEGGTNVFNQNRLGGNGQQPETVVGTVVKGAPGDEDKYKVSFKVFNNGRKRNGTFHIDPKIQIRP